MKTITRNLSTRKTRRCTKNKKLVSLLPRVDPGVFFSSRKSDDSLMRQGRILEEEEGEVIGEQGQGRGEAKGEESPAKMMSCVGGALCVIVFVSKIGAA